MDEKVPKVYRRLGPTLAEVGPPGVWSKGDEMRIPARPPGTLDSGDPGSIAFNGRVTRVDEDGIVIVSAVP